MRKQLGLTLVEVLIALTLLSVIGIASLPFLRSDMQNRLDEQGIAVVKDVVSGFKRYRAVNRRNPATLNELFGTEFYPGDGTMPWGSNISGASSPSGRSYVITIPARDPLQAERLAGKLLEYGASFNGSIVTLTSSISTIETVADQMLCRRDIGIENCNRMEVALDAGGQDISGADEIEGNIGRIENLFSNNLQVSNLDVTEEILLGANSIGFSGNTIEINAQSTSIGGGLTLLGDFNGNNTDISGVSNLAAMQGDITDISAVSGDIEELNGVSIEYQSAIFGDISTENITSETAEITNFNGEIVNATETTTNSLDSDNAIIGNLSSEVLSGDSLAISGGITTSSISSEFTDIGVASGTSLSLTGAINSGSAGFNSGSFGSLNVSGTTTANRFEGTDFSTSDSSVNSNKMQIDQQTADIAENSDAIQDNADSLARLDQDIQTNSQQISNNAQNIAGNTQRAQNNAANIASNRDAIQVNATLLSNLSDDIQRNSDDINSNKNDIAANSLQIQRNVTDIATNTDNNQRNSNRLNNLSGDIQTNTDAIAVNTQNASTNATQVQANADAILANEVLNQSNLRRLTDLNSEIVSNSDAIGINATNIVSNEALARDNARRITTNASDIGVLQNRATQIETGVASLRTQLETCRSQGGCSW